MLNRDDYQVVAGVVRQEEDPGTRRRLAFRLAKRFQEQYENFDREYFVVVCLTDGEYPPRPSMRNRKGREALQALFEGFTRGRIPVGTLYA